MGANTGRVALVTGGGRGIGRAISLGLAADGADVAVNYRRDEAAAQETVAEIQATGRRANAYQASSLDAPAGEDSESSALPLVESLGAEEPSYGWLEDYLAIEPLLGELSDRERQVLRMRFFESRTQSQIAAEFGVSQMHISRILSRTLGWLRDQALRD